MHKPKVFKITKYDECMDPPNGMLTFWQARTGNGSKGCSPMPKVTGIHPLQGGKKIKESMKLKVRKSGAAEVEPEFRLISVTKGIPRTNGNIYDICSGISITMTKIR